MYLLAAQQNKNRSYEFFFVKTASDAVSDVMSVRKDRAH
jgi:hypothetical protein